MRLLRSDVMRYLLDCQQRYDIIIADPPTYSNSHSRQSDWDVQRDHVDLLMACKNILNPDGVIYFSNNYRKFKLSEILSEQLNITDISQRSLDRDFAHHPKIHQCFELTIRK